MAKNKKVSQDFKWLAKNICSFFNINLDEYINWNQDQALKISSEIVRLINSKRINLLLEEISGLKELLRLERKKYKLLEDEHISYVKSTSL